LGQRNRVHLKSDIARSMEGYSQTVYTSEVAQVVQKSIRKYSPLIRHESFFSAPQKTETNEKKGIRTTVDSLGNDGKESEKAPLAKELRNKVHRSSNDRFSISRVLRQRTVQLLYQRKGDIVPENLPSLIRFNKYGNSGDS